MEKAKITLDEANRLLERALQNANIVKAKEALHKGADPRKGGYRLLELAARTGENEIVDRILKQSPKADLNNFAMLACRNRLAVLLLDIQNAGGKIRIDKSFVLNNQDTLRWLSRAGIKAQIILEAFKVAEEKHKGSPELLDTLIEILRKSESHEKYQNNLNFLLAESARNGKLEMLKLYEKRGGDVKSIPPMDLEYINKRGGGAVLGYLLSKGVKMGDFI